MVRPTIANRNSPSLCSWSATVNERGSPKIVRASSNDTPCFVRLMSAFRRSHSNRRPVRTPERGGDRRREPERSDSTDRVTAEAALETERPGQADLRRKLALAVARSTRCLEARESLTVLRGSAQRQEGR